jgi:hypothetical protein
MFYFCFPMDPALAFTVADLAPDELVRLPCACRIRSYDRRALIGLLGRDARLHLIGLRRELWCDECGEAPFHGWLERRPS